MTTISGTPLSAPGTVLLSELADKAQTAVSDAGAGQWPQATIEEWLNLAIADYSNHFTRTITGTITTTANIRKYDLPANFRHMLIVEYPTGQDPPEYLSFRSHKHRYFWTQDGYYDVIGHQDAEDPAELWISESPDAAETITVTYQGDHDHALTSSEPVTVPSRHHNILIAFVVWQAWRELLAQEQQSPTDSSSLIMSQLGENTDRAERAYRRLLRDAQRSTAGQSGLVVWRVDETETIY